MIIRAFATIALLLGSVSAAAAPSPSGNEGLGPRFEVVKRECRQSGVQIGRIVPVGLNKWGEVVETPTYHYGVTSSCERARGMDGKPNPYAKWFAPPKPVAKPAPKPTAKPAILILPAKVRPDRVTSDANNVASWKQYCDNGKVFKILIGKSGEVYNFPVTDDRDVQFECRAAQEIALR